MGSETKESSNEIAAEVPSSLYRMLPYLLGFVFAYQVIYATVYHAYSDVSSLLNLPKPSEEFCQGQDDENYYN